MLSTQLAWSCDESRITKRDSTHCMQLDSNPATIILKPTLQLSILSSKLNFVSTDMWV